MQSWLLKGFFFTSSTAGPRHVLTHYLWNHHCRLSLASTHAKIFARLQVRQSSPFTEKLSKKCLSCTLTKKTTTTKKNPFLCWTVSELKTQLMSEAYCSWELAVESEAAGVERTHDQVVIYQTTQQMYEKRNKQRLLCLLDTDFLISLFLLSEVRGFNDVFLTG